MWWMQWNKVMFSYQLDRALECVEVFLQQPNMSDTPSHVKVPHDTESLNGKLDVIIWTRFSFSSDILHTFLWRHLSTLYWSLSVMRQSNQSELCWALLFCGNNGALLLLHYDLECFMVISPIILFRPVEARISTRHLRSPYMPAFAFRRWFGVSSWLLHWC